MEEILKKEEDHADDLVNLITTLEPKKTESKVKAG
jgi:hypothetical protein